MDYNQNQHPTENGQAAPQQQPAYPQQSPYQQPYVQQPRNPYQQPYSPQGGRYQKPPKKPVDVEKITNLLATYPKLSRAGQKEFWGRILKRIVITQTDDFFIEPI